MKVIHLSTSNPVNPDGATSGDPELAWVQLLVVLIAPSLGALSGLWLWPGPVGGTLYALCKVVLYGVPLYLLIKRLGFRGLLARPFQGCTRRSTAIGFVTGAIAGVTILLLWLFVLSGRVNVTYVLEAMQANGMTAVLKFLAFAAWLCLVNSLLEEIVFRWYVDERLLKIGLPFAFALPISASIFTMHHVIVLSAFFNWPLVVIGSVGVFSAGALWSLLLRRSNSLAPGWISHALVDAAIMLVGWWILRSAQLDPA